VIGRVVELTRAYGEENQGVLISRAEILRYVEKSVKLREIKNET
jgi:hypothetical protein